MKKPQPTPKTSSQMGDNTGATRPEQAGDKPTQQQGAQTPTVRYTDWASI